MCILWVQSHVAMNGWTLGQRSQFSSFQDSFFMQYCIIISKILNIRYYQLSYQGLLIKLVKKQRSKPFILNIF